MPFETPGAVERAERLAAVAAMVYLVFNEGYSAGVRRRGARAPLCDEAIRLARLLLRLFPAEPEIMGLAALMLLQHARAAARFDADGAVVLLEDQDRALWDREADRRGPGPDRQGDAPPPRPAPTRCRRPSPPCTPARRAPPGHRLGADRAALRHARAHAALAGRHPQPRRRRLEGRAARRRRWRMIEPLARAARPATSTSTACRAPCCSSSAATAEARAAFDRAIALANTAAEAAHIRLHLDRLAAAGAVAEG